MILRIGACSYLAVIFKPDAECGSIAVKLTKLAHKPEVYNVLKDTYGQVTCDCPDFVVRRENSGKPCKHGIALQKAGLIP